MKRTRSAGGVVVNNKNQVVVVSQFGETWSLPKGHMEENEDVLETAKREIYEESGIPIERLNYLAELGSYTRISRHSRTIEGNEELKEFIFFLFTTDYHDLAPLDPHNPEAIWVDINNVSTFLSNQKDKSYFESIIPKVLATIKTKNNIF